MTKEKTNYWKIATCVLIIVMLLSLSKLVILNLETNERIEKIKVNQIKNAVIFDEWKLSNYSKYDHQRESITYKDSWFQTGIIEKNTYYCMWGNYKKNNESFKIFFDIEETRATLTKKDLNCFRETNTSELDNCIEEISIEDW